MDVMTAVRDKANYGAIVKWFRDQGDLDMDQMVLLADTILVMSEEIYEHYRVLRDILKSQLQRIRRICEERGLDEICPEGSMRDQLTYVVGIAVARKVILPDRYGELLSKCNTTQE
ncbi:MAG: hypothetical protein LUC94_13675 [Clostridiales bacterium]|nr:hypothetical protein [Clostridiales bacterium]